MSKEQFYQYLSPEEAALIRRWHMSMNAAPSELNKQGIPKASSGQRARLCRAESIPALMMTDGFRALWGHIQELDDRQPDDQKNAYLQRQYAPLAWACIAGVLATVRNNHPKSLAQLAGEPNGNQSLVSELRFQQLQTAPDEEELLRRLRRLMLMLDRTVSLSRVADDILCWFSEQHQRVPRDVEKRIALKWATEYYRAASGK